MSHSHHVGQVQIMGRWSGLDKLPLLRVAEVSISTSRLVECSKFYLELGPNEFSGDPDKKAIHFANVGEQYFGFTDEERGFFSGYDNEMIKAPLHIAFEVPNNSLNGCTTFLSSRGVKYSPKIKGSRGWHGGKRPYSVYFKDPQGNIMELWGGGR